MKCRILRHFIRVNTVCKIKKKIFRQKNVFFFKNYNLTPLTPLDMYNGLSQVNCIKPERNNPLVSKGLITLCAFYNSTYISFIKTWVSLVLTSRLRAKKRSCSPPPLRNFADISYLKENFKPHFLRDVCTLCSGALVSNSLLHMLLEQTKEKNQNESLSYRKKTLNHLIIQISDVVCKLDA